MKFWNFFESYLKIDSVVLNWISAFPKAKIQSLKAKIQFLENYTGDFQITFKKDSKLHNNVFSAIKKVGHRAYLSAKTAFWVDIGHIDGDFMLSW
jgi:hypothetical protein